MKKNLKTIKLMAAALACVLPICSCGEKNADVSTSEEIPTITLFANFNPADINESDAAFIKQAEDALGIKVEFDIPPSTSYGERMQLMLASGEYPDAVLFLDTKDQAYLNAVDQDILIPVNEYITNAQNIQKYSYEESWEALKTKGDDNIYGIPRSSMVRNDGYIIREDWLEKVGLTMPQDHGMTKEEFAEMLKRFTLNDPDGNGKNDTYGMVASVDTNKKLDPICLQAFDCNGWQADPDNNGSYMDPKYSKTSQNYKKALEYTADLYKQGFIDPNSPTNTSSDATDKFFKGTESGVIYGFSGNMLSYEKKVQSNQPDAKLNYIYLKNDKGEIKGGSYSTGFWGHWGITSACKNPEAVVKFLDWILSDDGWHGVLYGTEGINYDMVDGAPVMKNDVSSPWKSYFMRRAADFDFFTSSVLMTEEEKERIKPIVQIGIDTNEFSLDMGYTPEVAREVSFINYQTTMDEAITKIVTGNEPVSAYDAALEKWYENGGDLYVEDMNNYIKSCAK